ncbi:Mu transposase C-terminal domain-containing protein [Methylocystis sp. JAN1]|uniref:Mu transposase C-terminal domain-containing protein n=1 Tax=Methylocystis sp. JAN1 TaxID=3397211 RepID=UPI003FA29869
MNDLAVAPHAARDDDVFLRPNVDSIDLMGKRMLCVGRVANPKGYAFREPGIDINHVLENSQIKQFFQSGRLAFVAAPEDALPPLARLALSQPLSSFTPEQTEEIERRLRYVEALHALGPNFSRSAATLQPVCDRLAIETNDHKPHGWFSAYRWWRLWDLAGRDPRALKKHDDKKGNRKTRLEDFQEAAIEEAIRETWLTRGRPSMATAQAHANKVIMDELGGHDAVLELIREGKPSVVSNRAVSRRCRKLGREVRLYNRRGAEATRNEMSPVGAGVQVRLPFERVECDFKYVRLFLVDDKTGLPLGTPYLMAAFDCFSGVLAGFDLSFDPPGRASTARCLKQTIGFKDLSHLPRDEDGEPIVRNSWPVNGVPIWFFLDNDIAFHSTHFFAAAKSLGCNVDFIPPGEAWKKGHIERFWQTCQQVFFDMFPGKVLRFYDKPGRDYDPANDAVLTLSEVRNFLNKAIVDHHNQGIDEESGLKRIDLWLQGVAAHTPKQPRQHDDLMELVGCYASRKAERRGIRIFGLRYNSRDLAHFRAGFLKDPRVEVRYDPDDLGKVWVIDSRNGRALAVPCTRPDYANGLSLHQHRVIRARAASRYPGGRPILMKELLAARAELLALGQKMIGETKGRRMRQRLAHFLGTDQSILEAYGYRKDDPQASKGHILDKPGAGAPPKGDDFDIDVDFEDAEDEDQARKDEDFVDGLVRGKSDDDTGDDKSKGGGSKSRRSKTRAPKRAETDADDVAAVGDRAPAVEAGEPPVETRTPPAETHEGPVEIPERPITTAEDAGIPPPAPVAAPPSDDAPPQPRVQTHKPPRILSDDD